MRSGPGLLASTKYISKGLKPRTSVAVMYHTMRREKMRKRVQHVPTYGISRRQNLGCVEEPLMVCKALHGMCTNRLAK